MEDDNKDNKDNKDNNDNNDNQNHNNNMEEELEYVVEDEDIEVDEADFEGNPNADVADVHSMEEDVSSNNNNNNNNNNGEGEDEESDGSTKHRNVTSTSSSNGAATSSTAAATGADYSKEFEFFTVGQNIFVFEQNKLWHAKVVDKRRTANFGQDATTNPEDFQYYIHYRGWKDSWNEWVHPFYIVSHDQLLSSRFAAFASTLTSSNNNMAETGESEEANHGAAPMDSAGIAKKNQSKKSSKSKKTAAVVAPSAGSKTKGNNAAKRPSKISKPNTMFISGLNNVNGSSSAAKRVIEPPSNKNARYQIDVPQNLLKRLVLDYHLIVRQRNVIELPKRITIVDLMDRFLDRISNNYSAVEMNEIEAVTDGICQLFESAVGKKLLYRTERKQFLDILTKYPQRRLTSIYGFEHLLRLLYQLPSTLSELPETNEAEIQQLLKYATLLLKYLDEHENIETRVYEPSISKQTPTLK